MRQEHQTFLDIVIIAILIVVAPQRSVPTAKVIGICTRFTLQRGVGDVRSPQQLGVAPRISSVQIAVDVGLEEGVVDAIVFRKVDILRIG